jgi:cytosine/uracil/thiamine/allantoin permease
MVGEIAASGLLRGVLRSILGAFTARLMAKVTVMTEIQEIPRLVSEFGTMAKEYMLQETVEPAKKLGWFTGFSIGAAAAWAVGILFLGVAGMRGVVERFPDIAYAEALGYVIAALVLALIAFALTKVVPRDKIVPAAPPGPTAGAGEDEGEA